MSWLSPTSASPLLEKLREQQPDLGAATKEVREALTFLKAESGAAKAAAAAPPRCQRGRRGFERGAEPRLHRLLPAAVRDGRRA